MWWVKKTRQKNKTEFFDRIPQSEKSVEKSLVEKALFRLCKKARFGLQSKKAACSTDKSDCVRNVHDFQDPKSHTKLWRA